MTSGAEGKPYKFPDSWTTNSRCASSKVLLTLCESVTYKKDDQSLRDLQEYLEARLLILKNIPVCNCEVFPTLLACRSHAIGIGQSTGRCRRCY